MDYIAWTLNWSTRMPPLDVSPRPAYMKSLSVLYVFVDVELSLLYLWWRRKLHTCFYYIIGRIQYQQLNIQFSIYIHTFLYLIASFKLIRKTCAHKYQLIIFMGLWSQVQVISASINKKTHIMVSPPHYRVILFYNV